jgi:uncharacterized protein YjlB
VADQLESDKEHPMPPLETVRKFAERLTGWARPSRSEVAGLVRERKPRTLRFRDDGVIPNHPFWPLILYPGAVLLPAEFDAAAVMEGLFESNGWGDSWRNGIYDYVHYHSQIHEVLGIARGTGKVKFGGNRGRTVTLKAGDVVILPAGTGHRKISASEDFLVVGAYPPSGTYDLCTSSEDHTRSLKTISKVGRPRKDPVFGGRGPLLVLWKSARGQS